jgi:alpha-galactosidase
VRAETYDARVAGTQVLTPPSGPAPAINGPEVYGVRPGSPVIYRIPTTGSRPIRFTARDLPDTLRIDQARGIITGHAPAAADRRVVTFLAENDHGKDERKLTFVVGDKFALPPPMGWNHWYTHYHFITDGIDQPCGMRDLWRRKDAGTVADRLTVRVGPRGCAVLRLAAAKTTGP